MASMYAVQQYPPVAGFFQHPAPGKAEYGVATASHAVPNGLGAQHRQNKIAAVFPAPFGQRLAKIGAVFRYAAGGGNIKKPADAKNGVGRKSRQLGAGFLWATLKDKVDEVYGRADVSEQIADALLGRFGRDPVVANGDRAHHRLVNRHVELEHVAVVGLPGVLRVALVGRRGGGGTACGQHNSGHSRQQASFDHCSGPASLWPSACQPRSCSMPVRRAMTRSPCGGFSKRISRPARRARACHSSSRARALESPDSTLSRLTANGKRPLSKRARWRSSTAVTSAEVSRPSRLMMSS